MVQSGTLLWDRRPRIYKVNKFGLSVAFLIAVVVSARQTCREPVVVDTGVSGLSFR